MARKKVVHEPKDILMEVVPLLLAKPAVSWDDYQDNKDAGLWHRVAKTGENYLYADKETLRPIIEKYGQLNMNRALVSANLLDAGCRGTPCLQVKAKNSQQRIIVYAFHLDRLKSVQV